MVGVALKFKRRSWVGAWGPRLYHIEIVKRDKALFLAHTLSENETSHQALITCISKNKSESTRSLEPSPVERVFLDLGISETLKAPILDPRPN